MNEKHVITTYTEMLLMKNSRVRFKQSNPSVSFPPARFYAKCYLSR